MKRLSFSITILAILITATAGGCHHAKRNVKVAQAILKREDSIVVDRQRNFQTLSRIYNYDVNLKRYRTDADHFDSCRIVIRIQDKKSKTILDSVLIISNSLFDFVFEDLRHSSSHMTETKAMKRSDDFDDADMVITDFNFDGREDIAVVNNSGGNSGPTYSFFIQDGSGKFIFDYFLSDTMEFMPVRIDSKYNSLETSIPISASEVSVISYKYNDQNKSWRRQGQTFDKTSN